MFPPMGLSGGDEFVLRPSLCPHHALVFNARGAPTGNCRCASASSAAMYRAERSGVLGGLCRVRAISLNDAHMFCAADQVGDEVSESLRLIGVAHAALGFEPSSFRLSLRGEGGKYVGDPAMWARAAAVLRDALDDAGVSYVEAPGEAAFYGPKVDVQLATPPGGRGPSRPCRSTTSSRRGSTCPMWTPTARGAARSWCTAAWPAAWSGSSRT